MASHVLSNLLMVRERRWRSGARAPVMRERRRVLAPVGGLMTEELVNRVLWSREQQ